MRGLNEVLDSLALRAAHGSLHEFTFQQGHGFRGREVERLLLDHGIRIYERKRVGPGELGFSVRRDQAEWAETILCRAQVPLTCDLLDPENESLLNVGGEPRSLLERILAALSRFTE